MNRLELINKINSLKLIQKDWWEEVEFPQEIQEVLDICKIVDSELDINKHRWYEVSTTVYELNGEYFGIKYVTNTYSESSSIMDMFHTIKAFPMKQIQTVSYETENN